MIRNPIIHKEVLSALRTKKAVAMQAMFLLAAVALVWLRWPGDGLQDIGGDKSRALLSILALGELILAMMFAPSFTAASLTLESEQNTLESLFTTALKPWEITLGKMVGSLSFLLLLVLSGVPALSVPFLLGGVSGWEVLVIVGVLLLTGVYLGMIGLLISTMMHRSYRSIIVTYVVLLVVCFVVAIPIWPVSNYLLRFCPIGLQRVLHVVASLSPLQAMLSLVWPTGMYVQGAKGMPPFWQLYLLLSSLAILCIAVVCFIRLRHPPAPPRPREKLKVVERGVSARTFFFIIDPRKRKRMISWWKNPVLCKEFRTRPMLQLQWLLRAVGICLIVSVLLMFLVNMSVMAFVGESAWVYLKMATAVAAMMVVLIVLIGPAISGGVICSDRETGVWDLLRVTPIPSWRIVSGKFQASIIPLLLLTIATLPGLFLLLFFKADLLPNVLRICYVIAMTIIFVTTAGTFFSSVFARTATATAWTYALVVSISLLSLLILLSEDIFSQRVIAAVFVINPVAAVMEAAGRPLLPAYSLLNNHLKIMGIATGVMFLVTVARVFQLRRAE